MIASMAVGGHTGRPRRWLDALFGEARELERRRRRRHLLVALLCGLITASLVAGLRQGGSGALSGAAPHVRISWTPLSLRGDYAQLGAVGHRIVVTGGAFGGGLIHGHVTGICHSATVNPLTLRVISRAQGNCGNPALYGRRVLPVTYVASHSGPTGLMLAVRIATVASGVRDGYRLGPVVLTYSQCSDCQIGWIYGDGSLWVYTPQGARMGAGGGELYRISQSTGRVLQRWAMPVFLRPLLAVDSDGLWLSQSLYSGIPSHIPTSQRADYRSIYRVAPGMRTPMRARQLGSLGAYWMVASGHSVWIDESNLGGDSLLWRLDGGGARVVLRARRLPGGSACGQFGSAAQTIAGNAAAGIYCIGAYAGRIRGFDPARGTMRTYAAPNLTGGPAVSLGSSVYLLGLTGSRSLSRLYRVSSS